MTHLLAQEAQVEVPLMPRIGMDDVQRTLGELSAEIRQLIRAQDDSKMDRSGIREAISDLDDKVDPISVQLDALRLQVQAHEIVINLLDDQRKHWEAATRLGRWFVHVLWLSATTVALVWGDYIKFPLGKLLGLMK